MTRYSVLDKAALRSGRFLLIGLMALALSLASIPGVAVQAAAGDLDPSFGNGGKATDPLGNSSANALALQSDGKIIAAGTLITSRFDFGIFRYTSNGALDPTFGNGGRVATDFAGGDDFADAVAIQPDGKIVAVGEGFNSDSDIEIARYNSNGSLDTSFGTGGKIILNLSPQDQAHAVVIQNDGKIAVAGTVLVTVGVVQIVLLRFNADGSPDLSFGTAGRVFTLIGPASTGDGMVLDGQGRLVVAGGAGFEFGLARYNPNGTLDTSFGVGGIVQGGVNAPSANALALTLQSDGKLVAAGFAVNTFTGFDFAVTRYNSNGSVDTSFNSGLGATLDFFGLDDIARDVVVQPDGKIIIGGSSQDAQRVSDFTLARFNANGSLDTSFGVGGKVLTDFSQGTDFVTALALQSDGKLLAAGEVIIPFGGEVTGIARYQLSDLQFNLCLQDESNSNRLQLNTTTGDYQFTNCAGLSIGGKGTLTKRGTQITLQHNAADRRVTATIDTASKRATASIQLLSQGRTFSITDRDTSNNTCGCR